LKPFKDPEFMVKSIRGKSVFDLRVYYEDTDFSGRVYHASYLRFLERGRTEWLRALGFDHRTLAGEAGLFFAVRGLQIEYLAPALMDDPLTVETEFCGTRGAIIEFNQQILRREQPLVHASVRVVTMRNNRPVRAPRELTQGISGATRRA
jgi:acyl-CoA thioester hydrolase